jgi:ribosomal protein L11 methyltransferase
MPTWTALTTLPGRDAAEALGEALDGMTSPPSGVGVFEIEDGSGLWEVGAYFEKRPDTSELALVSAAFEARPFAVSELPDTDWVAKVRRELAPVRAGRFYLYGSHDAETVPAGVVALLVEASMAFGTGHHGTTLGCLHAFDRLLDAGAPPVPVADIGCGTAVLAMAAARVWPEAPVIASDIDPVAVEVAEANLAANALAARVPVVEAAGLDHPALDARAPFGLVFANILKGPLVEMAPAIAAGTAQGGHAILSGLLTDQTEEVEAAYAAVGFAVHRREAISGWSTLCLRKS